MAKAATSQKRVLIDAANKRVILATSIAVFVVMFSLVASQALFSQLLYQNRIISAKKQALTQLKQNESAVANLKTAYAAFVATPQNVIGGNSDGTGVKDGDNAKVVLDALPSKYDFPAMTTSLEKLVTDQSVQIQSITGTDDEVAQSNAQSGFKPVAVPMPFQLTAGGNLQAIQNLTGAFEASIRPIQLQQMSLSGNNANLVLTIQAQTFYQPASVFSVGKKAVN